MIQGGCVRLAGAVVQKPGVQVEFGQSIDVELRETRPARDDPAGGRELVIVHEDEDVIVIDKPARVLSHPTGPRAEGAASGGSVSEMAAARYGALPTLQGADRPGIVHRLDGGTSGVMVLGRNETAFAELMRQFRERTVKKSYLALAFGEPRFDTGWIEEPIARSTRDPARFEVVERGKGRKAVTYYEVRERFDGFALFECRPRTGRTHQIRVHLHSIGHPLVGIRALASASRSRRRRRATCASWSSGCGRAGRSTDDPSLHLQH
jgi:23S rRNA pseudouridine1911/1915/1917 synthase